MSEWTRMENNRGSIFSTFLDLDSMAAKSSLHILYNSAPEQTLQRHSELDVRQRDLRVITARRGHFEI